MKLPFRLPFSLPELNLSEIFNFTGRELRIIIVGASSVLIFAVVITALVTGLGRSRDGSETAAGNAFSAEPVQGTSAPASERPFLSDFILPEDEMEKRFTEAVAFREPVKVWSDEQIQRFWINLDEVAEDLLEMEARKVIRDIFADVQ